jgi:hypothetical protein
MSQIAMILVGLALSIASMITVGPSLFQSGDAVTATKVVEEVNAIRHGAKLWVAKYGTDNDLSSMSSMSVAALIPDMPSLQSKAVPMTFDPFSMGVRYEVYGIPPNKASGAAAYVEIVIQGMPEDVEAAVTERITKTPTYYGVYNPVMTDGQLRIHYTL